MKSLVLRYEVRKCFKFEMFYGFKIWDNKEKTFLPFEFDEDENHQANTKCELKNALNG